MVITFIPEERVFNPACLIIEGETHPTNTLKMTIEDNKIICVSSIDGTGERFTIPFSEIEKLGYFVLIR